MSDRQRTEEDYFFNVCEENYEPKDEKYLVLIIYDIGKNKKRVKLAKFLQGYGFRIQKSCFEAILSHRLFDKLLKELQFFIDEDEEEDSIRVYKLYDRAQIYSFGRDTEIPEEEVIVI